MACVDRLDAFLEDVVQSGIERCDIACRSRIRQVFFFRIAFEDLQIGIEGSDRRFAVVHRFLGVRTDGNDGQSDWG